MKLSSPQGWWVVGGAILVVVLILVSLVGQYAGASLWGADRGTQFRPLVRHEMSQLHCYDVGSQLCESQTPQPFEKEFTIGYVRMHSGTYTKPLYSCINAKQNFYLATTNKSECSGLAGTRVELLGQIFTDNNLEAPFALYRCLSPDKKDSLLTDDPEECALVNYQAPQLLGYIPSAGHLPQRRLNDLCGTIAQHCSGTPSGGLKQICDVHVGLCKGPS